ncbi:MAG: twin-arginine translocase subunit TatC [Acidobacteria bacterium]|nr:twin-arginine translocase subunit TatC [Acidobacteriota bacterium]MBI3657779.1 twin-arginine translocase subunit TatC [Acidobacteriota bacterium]
MKDLETEREATLDQEPAADASRMSFLDHLEDLRKRLINIVYYLIGGFVLCWIFHEKLFKLLSWPINKVLDNIAARTHQVLRLIIIDPTEAFTLTMKVCFVGAIFLTSPLILYEVWKFIAPGLYQREKKYAAPFVISSLLLFFTGIVVAYTVVMPPALEFLLDWGIRIGATPQIRISEYFDLALTIVLGFGLIFEMPVVVGFLALFGLVNAGFLWRHTKYAILIIFIVAAVISPTGDIFNQCIYAAPMLILYFISIGVAALCSRARKRPKTAA